MPVASMNDVVAPMVQQANPNVQSYMRIHGFYNTADLSSPSNSSIAFSFVVPFSLLPQTDEARLVTMNWCY